MKRLKMNEREKLKSYDLWPDIQEMNDVRDRLEDHINELGNIWSDLDDLLKSIKKRIETLRK